MPYRVRRIISTLFHTYSDIRFQPLCHFGSYSFGKQNFKVPLTSRAFHSCYISFIAFFVKDFICFFAASLNFKNMQCGTRFTFLSHCQFVLIELVSVFVFLFLLVSLLSWFVLFSHHITHTFRVPRQLSRLSIELNVILVWVLCAMCYMCLHALHSSICLYWSQWPKTWKKADVSNEKKKKEEKWNTKGRKNKTTLKQKQIPNKKNSKIKSNQSQRFAFKTLDKQNEWNRRGKKKKKFCSNIWRLWKSYKYPNRKSIIHSKINRFI